MKSSSSGVNPQRRATRAPSSGHELNRVRVQLRGALGQPQHLDANHLVLLVEIQHDPRRHFFGLDDRRVVQAQLQSVPFAVNLQFHNLPFIVRSKYTLTTRSGATVVLTTTRNTRFPRSGIWR